jgi:hypothetical protein
MKKLMILAAVLLASTAALGDPYAASDLQQRAQDYRARRDTIVDAVRFVYFAHGCGVLHAAGAGGIRNHWVMPLYSPLAGIDAIPERERKQLDPLIHGAETDGLERAKFPGTCDWFKDHPEAVRYLRDAQERGVH